MGSNTALVHVDGVTVRFGGGGGREQRLAGGARRRDPRVDRPERCGKDHPVRHHHGHVGAHLRSRALPGRGRHGALRGVAQPPRHAPHVPTPAALRLAERGGQRAGRSTTTAGAVGSSPTSSPCPRAGAANTSGAKARRCRRAVRPLRPRRRGRRPLVDSGKVRLLELARAIVDDPKVLLLDEPTSGLEEHEAERFGEIVREVRDATGCAVLLIEYDVPFVMGLCDRITVLNLGEVIVEGTPTEVSSNDLVLLCTSAENQGPRPMREFLQLARHCWCSDRVITHSLIASRSHPVVHRDRHLQPGLRRHRLLRGSPSTTN